MPEHHFFSLDPHPPLEWSLLQPELHVKHEGGGTVTVPRHPKPVKPTGALGMADFTVARAGFGGLVRELEDGRFLIPWKLRTNHTPGAIEAAQDRLGKVLGQAVEMAVREPLDGWVRVDITWPVRSE